MKKDVKVDVINLGDELLLGLRDNGHLTYLGRELKRHGLEIRRNHVVRDDPDEIRDVFPRIWSDADLVITTGGLGPTSDDLSREVIAEALGLKLEFVESVRMAIEERFALQGRPVSANNFKQCYVLEGAEVLSNPHGTAPGVFLKLNDKILVMLPGPENELRPMFEERVLPRLQEEDYFAFEEQYMQLRSFGIGESMLENKLRPVLKSHPELKIGYCAHQGLVDVRLSLANGSGNLAKLHETGEQCMELLGEDFVCFGSESLPEIPLAHLRAHEQKLAVAESCTGGLLASAFTDIPGASATFAGSVVCYHEEAKIEHLGIPECILRQHDVVSAETAVAMATGAAEKFSADYGLSTTGLTGPGGDSGNEPVGTVYFGLHTPSGAWSHRVEFSGDRLVVKARAVNAAIDWLRRKINKYQMHDAFSCNRYNMGAGI
ncbi:MAG: CinA family nicotinamide mononucleotide deamidase-related protein [Opitutae bacterium]|nr:CinA family nicotinamide mononucleotide deamidase-related protein [Opitutae bacterium]